MAAPFASSAIPELLNSFSYLSGNEITANEDFWKQVRLDYKLKPDYINLESGYYNIIPTPTLNRMIDHVKMVNLEGSYYMRTVQWENKKRMTEKLAQVVGSTSENIIITPS